MAITFYVTEDDLRLQVFLPGLSDCQNDRHVLPYSVLIRNYLAN